MDFEVPAAIGALLADLDEFIDAEIVPLEHSDGNERFFDHRREAARTDFEHDGRPRPEWHALLDEARRRADAAGFLRWALPTRLGGSAGSSLGMAIVREHLAHRGPGLHNDLPTESSVVGNFPTVLIIDAVGTPDQRALCEPLILGTYRMAFALTEPAHGSDATWLETTAVRDGSDWVINGTKRFVTGADIATHTLVFARTSGTPGQAAGITCFCVPADAPGHDIEHMWWTFNMPTDHGELSLRDVRVPASAVLGEEGDGLRLVNMFVHENRLRQAAAGVGAAQFCIDRSVAYAKSRVVFGTPLWLNQAIQFPLVELHTRTELVRNLVRKVGWCFDNGERGAVADLVSMANYQGNRLVCDAADLAMQVHGGLGYSRHTPFEHIYRHHRRYRITEGSDEIHLRRVAHALFADRR